MEIDFDALIQTFKAEADENLSRMEESLVALEDAPGDTEVLHTIFRVAHTLKGNAAALGYTGLTEFAHRLEDSLDLLLKGKAHAGSGLITALLKSVDAMRDLISISLAGNVEMQDGHKELLESLTQEVRTGPPAAPAASSPPVPTERRATPGRRNEDVQGFDERTRTLRVHIDKLDRMLNLTGEIAIARGRLRQMLDELALRGGEDVRDLHRDSDRFFLDLQELVMKIRMVPIGPTFRQHIRTVRDLATSSGKLAHLELEGEDVEVDTSVVNLIRDPLTHMLRNSVDHGIESPEQRRAAGKNPCGLVRLKAYHDTGNIVIEISDDGAGLSRDRILERARSRGLISETDKLSEAELHRLIFEPGFSTAEKITDVSGRGVGMDVVRRNIEALRGSVTIDSKEGAGTTLTVRLPLTLAIIDGFLVGVAGETYVLPLDVVVECVELPASERHSGPHGVINLRGKSLPYLRLRHLFHSEGQEPAREQIVVVQNHEQFAGLVVDNLYGENQTVIKPLGKVFEGLPGVSGSTILGNGRIALILDVPAIVRSVSSAAEPVAGV